MDPVIVALLKYGFLLLLALFVFWAVFTIASGMRVPKPTGAKAAGAGASGGGAPKPKRTKGGRVPAVVLVRTNGKRTGSYKLREPMQIGRAAACEISPPDDYLSQFHARLFPRDGGWFIEDLGSTNGTLLNGQKVGGPVEVQAGDEVQLGRSVLLLRR